MKLLSKQQHPFHLVTNSPWPLLTSCSLFAFTLSIVTWFHVCSSEALLLVTITFFLFLFTMCFWFTDVVTEATFEGQHTIKVQKGLRLGMLLFIISELFFFISFFTAFFYSSVNPSIFIANVWPPKGIEALSPWGFPLLNTVILLSSGITISLCHRSILQGTTYIATWSLAATIFLGILFTMFQLVEYLQTSFSLNSGIYGSIFFLATGFHGLHVIIGTIVLLVCLIRQIKNHFTIEQHFGFEAAAWYWHFVDVVWLFLFITVYWWGN